MEYGEKRNPVKTAGIMLACLLLSAVIGTVLLFGAYCLPTGPIDENVRKSATVFAEENTYQSIFSWCTSMLDNFTDAYMLLEAADETEGTVPERALLNYPGINGWGPREVLVSHYTDGTPLPKSIQYARYWHGYEIWLKPLLSVMTYRGIRIINGIVQCALVLLTCFLLFRRRLKHIILPFILTYLMLMPLALAESLQFSACFYTGILAMILLLSGKRVQPYLVFLFSGIATAYFDLSTYPVFTFGMPAVLYFAMNPAKNVKGDILHFIWIGFCWGLGYAGMWVLKWVTASLLTGQDIFSDALNQLRARTSDVAQDEVTHVRYAECAFRNVLWFARTPAAVLTGCYCIWNCLPFSRRRIGEDNGNNGFGARILPYLLIALVPFEWFALTINHSYIHIFFVNKTLAISVFAATVWITGLFQRIRDSRKPREQVPSA